MNRKRNGSPTSAGNTRHADGKSEYGKGNIGTTTEWRNAVEAFWKRRGTVDPSPRFPTQFPKQPKTGEDNRT